MGRAFQGSTLNAEQPAVAHAQPRPSSYTLHFILVTERWVLKCGGPYIIDFRYVEGGWVWPAGKQLKTWGKQVGPPAPHV